MESDTVCTGQLHINPEIIKTHRIIARRRFLCLLFEGSYRPDRVTAGERKDRYISQVADTRTWQVRMAESIYLAIIVMIAATGVPAHDMCIGTDLYKSKRTGSTGKGMPVKACPYKWVHVLDLIA